VINSSGQGSPSDYPAIGAIVSDIEADPGPSRGPAGVLHINVDAFNQQVLDDHHAWSRERVVEWSEQIHVSLLEALAALPTERVLNGRGRHGARQWFWMPAVQHSGGHRRQLERAINPNSP